MTREEIIALAREAGDGKRAWDVPMLELKRFAALITERVQAECIELVEQELRRQKK